MSILKQNGAAAGLCALLLATATLTVVTATPAVAQITISVNFAPPALPIYVQPELPAPGYIWTPGYWAWDEDVEDYYWVPGAWVAPPRPGLLWTPGYWGWSDGVYLFHTGYWAATIGFYGGVNYGYGYNGSGYYGGEWRGNQFYYNKSVSNVTNVNVTNIYNKTVIVNNNAPRTSFNGGPNGVAAKPTPAQLVAAKSAHVEPTAAQVQHVTAAKAAPDARFKANKGKPAKAVIERPLGLRPVVGKPGPGAPAPAIAKPAETNKVDKTAPPGGKGHEVPKPKGAIDKPARPLLSPTATPKAHEPAKAHLPAKSHEPAKSVGDHPAPVQHLEAPHPAPAIAPHPTTVIAPHRAPAMAPHPAPAIAPHPAPAIAPHPAPAIAPHPAPVIAPHRAPVIAPHPAPQGGPHCPGPQCPK